MAHGFPRSIHARRVPPNWSPRDWSEEMKAEAIAAALEAERDFDQARGVPLEAFVHQRVWARSLSCYRREWTYARRCGHDLEGSNDGEVLMERGSYSIDISDSLLTCLRRLPDHQRHLIEYLFWQEKTEVELARMLCLTQSGINRRKRRILDQLRRWIDRSEKEKSGPEKD
jgi:RNA polymerase sigma factor (sigma-70 family)